MINVKRMYQIKAQRAGASEGSQSFQRAFLHALDMVQQTLNFRGHQSLSQLDDVEGEIDLDTKFLPVVSAGLDFFIQEESEWTIDDTKDLEARWERMLIRAITESMKDDTPKGKFGNEVA